MAGLNDHAAGRSQLVRDSWQCTDVSVECGQSRAAMARDHVPLPDPRHLSADHLDTAAR
jgi:hypothetical protein